MTVEPTWDRVEKPILEALAATGGRPSSGQEVIAATRLEAGVVMRSLRSLKEDGLIDGVLVMVDQEPDAVMADGLRLMPDGLRAAGVWPSRDYAARLIEVLRDLAANEPDEVVRTRWERALTAVQAVGSVGLNAAIGQAVGIGVSHIPGL